jgi:DegV family protein with EDD domain
MRYNLSEEMALGGGDDMKKCAIFTNSVSDLSPSLSEEYGIFVIPDVVIFENREYFTNIDIDPPMLYRLMREHEKLPTTSHPNQNIYMEHYAKAEEYSEILCITVTSVMSGSGSTAALAARMMREKGFRPEIYIYDSLQVSYGLAYLAIEAAKMAQKGLGALEIIAHLDQIRNKVGSYFCLYKLENARKGGRIGEVKSLTADFLGIKPVLTFKGGTVKELGIARSFDAAIHRIIRLYKYRAKKGGLVFVCHANNEEVAQRLKEQVARFDPDAKVLVEWIGVAIGIYTGERTVGLIFGE